MNDELRALVTKWRAEGARNADHDEWLAGYAKATSDRADQLEAALSGLLAQGWRGIESAPNFFLGYEKGDFGPVIYGVIRGPLGDFKLLADPEFEVDPTHWMPLPAPPTAAAKKSERQFESDQRSEFR